MLLLKKMLAFFCVSFLLMTTAGCGEGSKEKKAETKAQNLVWGSAALGGSAQMVASAIGTVVNKYDPTLKISVQATQGSDENPRLLRDKRIDICHTTSGYDAFSSQGSFKGEAPVKLQALFTMYSNEEFICVLDNSPIKAMQDLVGKKICVGPPSSGGHQMAVAILEAYGLMGKVKIINLGYNEAADALKDGVIDALALFTSGSIPSPALAQLDQSSKIRLIPMDQNILKKSYDKYPDINATVNRKGSLKSLSEDFYGLGTFSIEFADERMSEQTAYSIVKNLFEHLSELKGYHKLCENIDLKKALNGLPRQIPVHPGAAKYYKEKGVWNDSYTVGKAIGK